MDWPQITNQLLAGVTANFCALSVGFHMGWAAPSLPKLLSKDSDIILTSSESSWIVGCFTAAGAVGSFVGSLMVDRCGRRLSLLIAVIPQVISCILIGAAQGFWWLVAARLVAGGASGLILTALPMYLGEIADDRIRGALGSLVSVMLNIGILVTYSVGPWVNRQALAGLGGALVLLFGLTFVRMPESPYFLVMKGKMACAEETLLWFRGRQYVDLELRQVRRSVEVGLRNTGTLKELITIPGNCKALMIVLGLGFAQQLSGIGAVLSYSSIIFGESGSTLDSSVSVIVVGVVQLLSGVLTLFVIDLAGRRPLLLFSTCGSALFLGGESLYFQLQSNGADISAVSWLPVTAVIGFIISYAMGLACIPYVLLSEMFPCNVKSLAVMAVTQAMCVGGFVVAIAYQAAADEFGIHIPFWGFTGITIVSAILIYLIVPETKQQSLESIQVELHQTTDSTMNPVTTEAASTAAASTRYCNEREYDKR